MENAIEVDGLTRRFGRTEAVNGLGFQVPTGCIFGLLGPNGAGKTTTLKMLVNLLTPSAGRARVLGVDSRRLGPAEFRRIGYVSEDQQLPEGMTGEQFLAYLRPLYPTWDQAFETRLLDRFHLTTAPRIGALSRGMRMKLALTSVLAFRPEVLILDEPFSGLDPLVRDEFIAGMLEIVEQERWTILISSHDVDEIERIADVVGIVNRGRLELAEPIDSLLARFRRITARTDAAHGAPSPGSWIGVEHCDGRVSLVETQYDEARTRAGVLSAFGGEVVSSEPMSLRAIFVALARHYRMYAEGEI
jgi:ABC-2 type transport system ATP-binding protein